MSVSIYRLGWTIILKEIGIYISVPSILPFIFFHHQLVSWIVSCQFRSSLYASVQNIWLQIR